MIKKNKNIIYYLVLPGILACLLLLFFFQKDNKISVTTEVNNIQEFNNLIEKSKVAYFAGNYKQAYLVADSTIQLISEYKAQRTSLDDSLTKKIKTFEAKAYLYRGNAQLNYNVNYSKVLNDYKNSLKLFQEIGDLRYELGTLNSIGGVYSYTGNNVKALKFHFEALKKANENGLDDIIAYSYQFIARCYLSEKNYEEALKYSFELNSLSQKLLNKSITSSDKQNYRSSLAYGLRLTGEIYLSKGSMLNAVGYFKEAANSDFAKENPYFLYLCKSSIASAYLEHNNTKEAKVIIDDILLLNKKEKNQNIIQEVSLLQSTYFSKVNQIDSAINYGRIYYDHQLSSNNLDGQKNAAFRLSDLYAKQKKHDSAYFYLNVHTNLSDSLISDKRIEQFQSLKLDYESQLQELKLNIANKEIQKNKVMNIGYMTLTILIFIIAFIYIRLILIRNKRNKEIEENRIRKLISNDLHDEIGSGLTIASLQCQKALLNKDKDSNSITISQIQASINGLGNKLKEVIWIIAPENNSIEKVDNLLREYCSDLLKSASADQIISYRSSIDNRIKQLQIAANTSRNLYLIMKESINNALKYSLSKNITIEFKIDYQKNFILKIEDNGIGFDIDTKIERGNGMSSLKTRANELGAKLSIESVKNKGSIILLSGEL